MNPDNRLLIAVRLEDCLYYVSDELPVVGKLERHLHSPRPLADIGFRSGCRAFEGSVSLNARPGLVSVVVVASHGERRHLDHLAHDAIHIVGRSLQGQQTHAFHPHGRCFKLLIDHSRPL